MAPRTFWKGYLKLSLVTCPVAMTPATTEAERIRLHMLNRATGHRLRSRYVDSVTGAAVEPDDQVKGWEAGPDEYVVLEDEELDSIGLAGTHTIDIERFVPREAIDRLWLDGAHYLAPNDPVGEEAFGVIRAAMAATDKVGIARLVIARRERHVMLEPRGRGIVVWTLRFAGEIRDEAEYFDDLAAVNAPAQSLALAERLVAERTEPWRPEAFTDPKDRALEKLIAAKKKGRRPARAEAAEPEPAAGDGKVVGIMEALRRSLEREAGAAKAGAAKAGAAESGAAKAGTARSAAARAAAPARRAAPAPARRRPARRG